MKSWKYVTASMLAQLAQVLVTFAIGVILPRILDPYSYGIYRTLRAIPQSIFGLSSFISAQTIIYFTSKSKNKAKIFSNLLFLLFISSFFSTAVLLFLSPYLAARYSVSTFFVAIASTELFFFSLMPLIYNFLKGLGNFILAAKMIILSHILRLIILFVALLFGVLGIFVWRNLYGGFLLVLSLFLLRGYVRLEELDFSLMKKIVKYDFYLFVNRFVGALSTNFIILTLGKINPKEVAYYTVAFFLANMLSILTSPIMEVGLFRVSNGKNHFLRIKKVTKYTTYLAGFMIVSYFAFGREILSILFPKEYLNAVPALYLLSFSYYISTLASGVSIYFLKSEKTDLFSKAALVRSFTIFLLSTILIPKFLSLGAALTFLAATVVYVAYLNFYFGKENGGAGRIYVLFSLLSSSVSIVIGKIVSKLLSTVLSIIVVPFLSLFTYILLLSLLGGFDTYDIQVLKEIWGNVKEKFLLFFSRK